MVDHAIAQSEAPVGAEPTQGEHSSASLTSSWGNPAAAHLRAEAPAFEPSKSVDDDGPMDVEAPASPRREQQRMLTEASEALASKAQLAHHRPPESETRPIRRFRRPRM